MGLFGGRGKELWLSVPYISCCTWTLIIEMRCQCNNLQAKWITKLEWTWCLTVNSLHLCRFAHLQCGYSFFNLGISVMDNKYINMLYIIRMYNNQHYFVIQVILPKPQARALHLYQNFPQNLWDFGRKDASQIPQRIWGHSPPKGKISYFKVKCINLLHLEIKMGLTACWSNVVHSVFLNAIKLTNNG